MKDANPELTPDHLVEAIADGHLMLTALSKAGATHCDVTVKSMSGEKVQFLRNLLIATLRRRLPLLYERNEQDPSSVIIRPRSASTLFVQLDDIDAEAVSRVREHACCILETSPGNYQGFLAVVGVRDRAEGESVRHRLISAVGADGGATGAVRIAGSLNTKEKHRREDGSFPRVELVSVRHGAVLTVKDLESAGLLGEAPSVVQAPPQPKSRQSKRRGARRIAPSYDRCVASVRRKAGGETDRSAVDALYAVTCLDWGFSFSETVDLLRTYSPKAAERSDDYAERTVLWAQTKRP